MKANRFRTHSSLTASPETRRTIDFTGVTAGLDAIDASYATASAVALLTPQAQAEGDAHGTHSAGWLDYGVDWAGR